MHTMIIAEAGVNHNGKMDLAYKLIDVAFKAGADYVKFQTWKSENIISRYAQKAAYQKETTDAAESMLEMEKRLELSYKQFIDLKAYCDSIGIGFLSTPFDVESARFLYELGLGLIKVPSGEITNLPLLEEIGSHPWDVILSTGMSEIQEIEAAIAVLGISERITLMQCNTQYPTPMQDMNLNVMSTLREQFQIPVGLSDHSLGIEVSIAAVALGARVIEKHITLDREMEGPDHKASIESDELATLVRAIRNIEQALGDGTKRITDSERENLAIARKSIVAKQRILKGELFTDQNLAAKRPGSGISPMRWHDIIGLTAMRDFEEDELIEV
ncbi:MAG: N-acetylneuraminate synthase [Clostridia bacterium]|nr:N-acetylneuraminate synthase [Clostridia bacterium]